MRKSSIQPSLYAIFPDHLTVHMTLINGTSQMLSAFDNFFPFYSSHRWDGKILSRYLYLPSRRKFPSSRPSNPRPSPPWWRIPSLLFPWPSLLVLNHPPRRLLRHLQPASQPLGGRLLWHFFRWIPSQHPNGGGEVLEGAGRGSKVGADGVLALPEGADPAGGEDAGRDQVQGRRFPCHRRRLCFSPLFLLRLMWFI